MRGRTAVLLGLCAAAGLAPSARTAVAAEAALPDSVRYAVALASVNRVGLTLTNYGFFGTNFKNKTPSFEFPLGDGYEHMSRAGLWVGAVALDENGDFVHRVSSAIVDNQQGSDSESESEFTPASKGFVEHSRISTSDRYLPSAISDQDLDCWYSDQPARGPAGYQQERHTPLDLEVHQRALGFTLAAADAFVVTRFTIINRGSPLTEVYVGLYAQLVSGNKNAFASFPPQGWYYKTYTEYDAGRRLYEERYCATTPYPQSCNISACPPWAAVKLLKVSSAPLESLIVSFNWWSYSLGDTARATDVQRYGLLSNGAAMSTAGCAPGAACSPIMLLSVGPLGHRSGIHRELDYGDSVTVDFAFVGGEDQPKLLEHADYAQFAAEINYKLPTAPPPPRLLVESGANRLDLYWDDKPETTPDSTSHAPGFLDFEGYRVYIGTDRNLLTRVAEFDLPDTARFNTGFGAIRLAKPKRAGGHDYPYHHAIRGLRDGFSYYCAVTSFDIGDEQSPSLESGIPLNKSLAVPLPAPGESGSGVTVFPNPYRVEARWDQGRLARDHYLWFANLPSRAHLRIYTLSGDLVYETRFDGANYHGEGARGLYDPSHTVDTPPPVTSGAGYAWNLITRQGEAAATGLYLYSVEDLDSGRISRGKFLIVKSDRE